MSGGKSVIRRPPHSKSNIELVNSLRAHFAAHSSGSPPSSTKDTPSQPPSWTRQKGDVLYIPSHHTTPLLEARESYDITCKLFFLPGIPSSRRCAHIHEAISLVLSELAVPNIDLLIVSYPGVSFDADDDSSEDSNTTPPTSSSPPSSTKSSDSSLTSQLATWRTLESLHTDGLIHQLGVSEFSSDRLATFLPHCTIAPTVDQINVKDCCVVPEPLIRFAKDHKIDLLTHNDCTDILPVGTTRELLGRGERGAGILAERVETGTNGNGNGDVDEGEDGSTESWGLQGDIEPQWVIKYTAVVKNRGVIENKGYFAVAQTGSCIEVR